MKNLLVLLALAFVFTLSTKAQIVYSCDSKYDADVKVYVADSKYDAEWRNSGKKHLMY